MKGIIFTYLSELIELNFGLSTLDKIITSLNLPSQGAYTAGETYDEKELLLIVAKLSDLKNIPVENLVHSFGKFLMKKFFDDYPIFFKDMNLKTFLLSIDNVIHVEVKKLYPEANPPKFFIEEINNTTILMNYQSTRKLNILAEGLIEEAAIIFNENIDITYKEIKGFDFSFVIKLRNK